MGLPDEAVRPVEDMTEWEEIYQCCAACCRELQYGTRGLNIQICGRCNWSFGMATTPIPWVEWEANE